MRNKWLCTDSITLWPDGPFAGKSKGIKGYFNNLISYKEVESKFVVINF
jgi:hypothetical protein